MKLIVADDSALFREGIVGLLERQGHQVIAQAQTAPELIDIVSQREGRDMDVVISDVRMPPTMSDDGLRAAVSLRMKWPHLSFMLLSQYVAPAYARELFSPSTPSLTTDADSGGLGYLLKDRVARVADFIRALDVVASGGVVVDPEVATSMMSHSSSRLLDLTEREHEILSLMAQGMSNAELADKLCLSSTTISKHVANIFTKLGMRPDEENRRVKAVLAYLMPEN